MFQWTRGYGSYLVMMPVIVAQVTDGFQVEALEKQHPLGFGTPEQVAGPALFLLSDDAQWITGTVLTVDGGLLSQ